MEIKKAHCLFEQSGTFKNEFIKLGIPSEDYDILNEFNQTDHVIDLYHEIEEAYDNKPSIFDTFKEDEFLFAFFPCVRFEAQFIMFMNGAAWQYRNYTDEQKMEKVLTHHEELHRNYELITKMVLVCYRKHLRMVIENPYSPLSYLTRYWPIKPKFIDRDRTKRGDYFEKPTQYWFINCEPSNNLLFEATWVNNNVKRIDTTPQGAERSLIAKEYANTFIREFLL